MNISNVVVSNATGCAHVTISLRVGNVDVSRSFLKSELGMEPEDVEVLILGRLRSFLKENNLLNSTINQINNAFSGQTFKI